MAKVTVDTKEFEFAHGRKPRGAGYWAFFFNNGGRAGVNAQAWFAPGAQTYAAAKRAAVAECAARGFSHAVVGS